MQFIFLMCSERSGSNFITRIFDAHPQVCGPSPVHLVRQLCDHALAYVDPATGHDALAEDTHGLLQTRVGVWRTDWTRDELATAATKGVGPLIRAIYEREAQATGKHTLFVKENHTWRYLPFLLHAFPEARFVWQVRDPRDMALSWKLRVELRGDVCRAADVWEQDQSQTLRAVAPLLGSGRVAVLRYEDLVDDTEAQLRRVCDTIGLPYHPAMLAYHADENTRANAMATGAWENIARPVMKGNHHKFLKGLQPDEIAWMEWKLGPLMQTFGYTPTQPPLPEPEAVEARLRASDRHEKPGYQDVSEEERQIRAARAAVRARMGSRAGALPGVNEGQGATSGLTR